MAITNSKPTTTTANYNYNYQTPKKEYVLCVSFRADSHYCQ